LRDLGEKRFRVFSMADDSISSPYYGDYWEAYAEFQRSEEYPYCSSDDDESAYDSDGSECCESEYCSDSDDDVDDDDYDDDEGDQGYSKDNNNEIVCESGDDGDNEVYNGDEDGGHFMDGDEYDSDEDECCECGYCSICNNIGEHGRYDSHNESDDESDVEEEEEDENEVYNNVEDVEQFRHQDDDHEEGGHDAGARHWYDVYEDDKGSIGLHLPPTLALQQIVLKQPQKNYF
jgi:hypothetical protein